MDAAAPAPPPPAVPPRRHWRRALFAGGALLIALPFALLATLWFASASERGSAWLLRGVPGLAVEAPQGALRGDFGARRVTLALPGGAALSVTDLAWRGLHLRRAPAPLWFGLRLDTLGATRVDFTSSTAPSGAPATPQTSLRLPVEVEVGALRITELHAGALGATPLLDVQAQLHLGADAGARHRIDALALRRDALQLGASAQIDADAPLALELRVTLAQDQTPASAAGGAATRPAWGAGATLIGPLAAPTLQATLRAVPTSGHAAQTLDVRATLHPFASWPLGALQASAKALDLAAFDAAWPTTAIDLQASATSSAANLPASVALQLTNPLVGRWNDGRLPLRTLHLRLAGRPDQPEQIDLSEISAALGDGRRDAGTLSGSGRWSSQRWSLALALQGLQPALLDLRAPAVQLNGPLTLTGGATLAAGVSVVSQLTGTVAAAGPVRAARLQLDASLAPERVELRQLRALAGGASATLSGTLARSAAAAPWQLKAQAQLVDFDPALWWPGAPESRWRLATHRLNAHAAAALSLPAGGAARTLAQQLGALRGQATLTLDPSRLAGVPLQGTASLQGEGGGSAAAALALDADGNRLRADATLAIDGQIERGNVTLNGGALDRLAPLFALFRPAGSDAALAGSVNASAHLSGRWPLLASDGRLDASALRVGALTLQHGQAQWQLGAGPSAPLSAQLTLQQARAGGADGPSLDSLTLNLSGSARAHTLQAHAESSVRPPAWTDALQGIAAAGGAHTVADLQADGGWVDSASGARGWNGTIRQIELRGTGAATPLLRARDLQLAARWADGATELALQPGRVELLGGALRWSALRWRLGESADAGPAGRLDVEAELEPLRVAPLLARAQPSFGWGGDLSVGGRVSLHAGAQFGADIVIERHAGDLSVTDELGTRALGLTDLRLGLNAAQGTWNFTQGLAGSTVGVLGGAVVARTTPQARWPGPDAPIQGVVELRVADLGTWGTWVPPGWRVGGALHSSASIGGTFGAPELSGTLDGSGLALRNALEGVNLTQGALTVRLQGTRAEIEHFEARGGDGSVALSGSASLGAEPKAQLQLRAEHFQLLGRVDRRLVVSGHGELELTRRSVALSGDMSVDEGLIDISRSDAPALAADVTVRRAGPAPGAGAGAADAAPAPAPARNVALTLNVALGDKLRLRGRGLDTGLRGALRLTAPDGRLAVNGSIQTADGTYAAYGQKLTIDRGLIVFSGALENPRLDIEATRPNLDIRVGVSISGNASNPRVRLFSEPEMAELDKLSWLVMGRASDTMGRTDTALLQRAAMALLAGEGSSPTDALIKSIGLDEVSVRQSDVDVHATVVALGKQISQRWYVGYERGLNTTTGSFQLIYRIAQRFTLRAQSGADDSLDLIWTWRWR